jgi:hypothetical protein
MFLLKISLDVFMKYFPKMFEYYSEVLEDICALVPDCKRPLGDLPFFAVTLNVGEQSVCDIHVDGSNLAGGLCLASPFGSFDHKRGGHLILHELNLVLSLPSGSFVLFPSGLISHENIPIHPHEDRRVFTAFSPASAFQWKENGFLLVNETEKVTAKVSKERGASQWARQKERFPHYRIARFS